MEIDFSNKGKPLPTDADGNLQRTFPARRHYAAPQKHTNKKACRGIFTTGCSMLCFSLWFWASVSWRFLVLCVRRR